MTTTRMGQILVIVAAAIGLGLMYPLLVGGSHEVTDDQLQEMVYVDIKTGESFLLAARTSPAEHPETGELTLVPGLYCEKCNAWKPVGSLEMLQTSKSARNCPIHKTPLIADGPLPE